MSGTHGPVGATLAVPDAGALGSSAVDLARVGLVAGRYELLALLGSGGMGAVYKARDTTLDELVALKVLRRALIDDVTILERFRREVKLARRVTHRNVARAHDIGEHNGEPFITMEFVDGESLRGRLNRAGPRSMAEVVEIGTALAAGLEAAHQAGVVHRDLKPDNVLMADDGRIVVTDFGIARAIDAGSPTRTQGAVIGTPSYMAPEQVEGSAAIDARTDIYALGVILFELCTGQLPFNGGSPYIVAFARLVTAPPDPRALGVTEAMAKVILRCLAREPNARYPRAADVAEALRAVELDPSFSPTMRPPPPPPEVGSGTRPSPVASAPPTARQGARSVKDGPKVEVVGDPRPSAPAVSAEPAKSGPVQRAGARAERSSEGPRSVAVMPLRNGGPKEEEHLADSFTEDLIDQISLAEGLRVRSFDTVLALKGTSRDARELSIDLGVDVVVTGSVRKVGDTLRIALRAVSATDGFQVWAGRYDRPVTGILAATDEIAAAVVAALTPKGSRGRTADPAARALYQKARDKYHLFEDVAAMAQLPLLRTCVGDAVALFEEARAKAPEDPTILLGATLGFARMWFFDADGADTRAGEAAARLAGLAPESAESHLARAAVSILDGNLVMAVEDAARALAKAPELADAHHLIGRVLCETGPAKGGIAHLESAATYDPGFVPARAAMLHVHELLGQAAEADRLAGAVIARREGGAGWASLARVILWRGDVGRARELWQHPVIASGKAPSAREILRMLVEPDTSPSAVKLLTTSMGSVVTSSRTRGFLAQVRAEVAAARGKLEEAFTALGDAVMAGLIDLVWMDGCALLREMRADRRFAALRAEVETRVGFVEGVLTRAGLST